MKSNKIALEFRRFRAESSQSAVNRRHCHSASFLSPSLPVSKLHSFSVSLLPSERCIRRNRETKIYYIIIIIIELLCERAESIESCKSFAYSEMHLTMPQRRWLTTLPGACIPCCWHFPTVQRNVDVKWIFLLAARLHKQIKFPVLLKAFSLASSVAGIALTAKLQSVNATWSRYQGQHLSN